MKTEQYNQIKDELEEKLKSIISLINDTKILQISTNIKQIYVKNEFKLKREIEKCKLLFKEIQ